ncbi:MAG TPA: DUF2625 family protein [Ktedonobacteraceae bacterium]|nr:DUF2625 family protein [Ktedonobacteraceae bacterium]
MNTGSSAWSEVQQWLQKAKNTVEILAGNREQGEAVFQHLRVSPRSLMGTLALETGGILVDHGWLRFLGSGNERMKENLLSWNAIQDGYGIQQAFIVAHDVVGGFFAMNGGAFPGEKGNIFYMAPDTLAWQNLGGSYSQTFSWALTGNLDQFYGTMRWPGWQEEVGKTNGDQGLSIIPFLWTGTKEPPVAERSRRAIPLQELWRFEQDIARQIQHHPPGTPIKINFT